ncbi:MAG: sigma-70 family RNA polymerase sigma factor, partial [Chloroflexota bacterium]
MRRAQKGDSKAVTELYLRYQRKVLNFLYRMTGNRQVAEDLMQETFVRVVRHLQAYRPTGSVAGWIYRIAENLALNRFRHEKAAAEIPLDSPLSSEEDDELSAGEKVADSRPDPGEEAVRMEMEATVQRALSKVSLPYRETVILCDIQGYSYKEAAEMLSCPIDTVASRLARGRSKLAELLG